MTDGKLMMLRGWLAMGLMALLLTEAGCSGTAPPAANPANVSPQVGATTDSDPAASETTPERSHAAELLTKAKAAFSSGDVPETRRLTEEIRALEKLSDDETRQLAELDAQLTAISDEENDAERDASLKRVAALIDNGQLDEAAAALETASVRKPTDEQREQIAGHRKEIERIRGAQRKLGAWMKLIGSKTRSEFRAAQTALLDEPEAALPLLLAALREPGDVQRTTNLLETLRQLRKPQATLPAIVGVLERPEQRDCWAEAVETLGRISEDGAGPLLLKLLLTSQDASQRAAALTALSRVPDPPAETVLSLLPRISQDSPDLAVLLTCVAQAARRHDQTDLVALHGFGTGVTGEQAQQLAGLSARLEALRSVPDAATARAAKVLSAALGFVTPEPISGVQVLNVSGEYPDSPGKAVVDGVWNSSDLKTMWYHPLGPDSQIVLDLGEERTVTGVVIWNFNQAGGGFRGWKRAEVFVSPTPTALTPVASGIVPMAPGVNDAVDYSTQIAVPCVTGRYVKLRAKDLWNPNSYTGLAEVQVLGF